MDRRGLLVVVAALMLGCSGLSRMQAGFTGTEIQFGAAATAPQGFPLTPPAGGDPYALIKATGETQVWYMVDGDPVALLDGYAQQMQAAGLTVERSVQGTRHMAWGTRPGERWFVQLVPSAGRQQLSMDVMVATP